VQFAGVQVLPVAAGIEEFDSFPLAVLETLSQQLFVAGDERATKEGSPVVQLQGCTAEARADGVHRCEVGVVVVQKGAVPVPHDVADVVSIRNRLSHYLYFTHLRPARGVRFVSAGIHTTSCAGRRGPLPLRGLLRCRCPLAVDTPRVPTISVWTITASSSPPR